MGPGESRLGVRFTPPLSGSPKAAPCAHLRRKKWFSGQGLTEMCRPSGTSSTQVLPGVRVILVPLVS